MSESIHFSARTSIALVEEGDQLAPKFDAQGLITCVTTDASTGELLMVGYMTSEGLEKTIQTQEAHYFSRSRQMLWHKGVSSGLMQRVIEIRIDDDQDAGVVAGSTAAWLEQPTRELSCGNRSCFYRAIDVSTATLHFVEGQNVRSAARLWRCAQSNGALICCTDSFAAANAGVNALHGGPHGPKHEGDRYAGCDFWVDGQA